MRAASITRLFYLFFLSLALYACSMDKNCQCDSDRLGPFLPFSFGEEWPPYSFEVPVSITSSNTPLGVGDTLTLSVNMGDSLKDIIYRSIHFRDSAGMQVIDKIKDIEPQQKYKLANYPFYFSLQFAELSEKGPYPNERADDSFKVLTEKGKSKYNSTYRIYDHYFVYENETYKLRLKVLALKKGVFALSLPTYNSWPAYSFPGSCTFRLQRGIRVAFNTGKSHYELAKQALGKSWHLGQITENTSSPYNFTISHDTLQNYSGPRAFRFQYCFEVK